MKHFAVVGRPIPTEKEPCPTIMKMNIFAEDDVKAKSKFWYFVSQLRKIKKTNGEILAINQVFEKTPTVVKNFGIWVRYTSRTGVHNMYKEYRDVTLTGAVDQLYSEMASRHRARKTVIQVMRTAEVKAADCRRANTLQFHSESVAFPLIRSNIRVANRQFKKTFSAKRPTLHLR